MKYIMASVLLMSVTGCVGVQEKTPPEPTITIWDRVDECYAKAERAPQDVHYEGRTGLAGCDRMKANANEAADRRGRALGMLLYQNRTWQWGPGMGGW